MATPSLSPAIEADTLRRAIDYADNLRRLLDYLQRQRPDVYKDDGLVRDLTTGLRERLAELGPLPPTIICRRNP